MPQRNIPNSSVDGRYDVFFFFFIMDENNFRIVANLTLLQLLSLLFAAFNAWGAFKCHTWYL